MALTKIIAARMIKLHVSCEAIVDAASALHPKGKASRRTGGIFGGRPLVETRGTPEQIMTARRCSTMGLVNG